MIHHHAVLFDLDGTLADTAPDLTFALNQVRKELKLEELSVAFVRPFISLGSKEIIKNIFQLDENHPDLQNLRERFIKHYENHIADNTQFFPNMQTVLSTLDHKKIPWSIVTNKLKRHTHPLLKALHIEERAACIVCGDTLFTHKPHPEPILHACRTMHVEPSHALYVGDSLVDVTASKAAGTKTLVALYGYIGHNDKPHEWKADGYINEPMEILDYL